MMHYRRVWTIAILAGTGVGLGSPQALAQQFTNRDFQSGDLTGWTITPTVNGTTAVQTVEIIDIDGPGPLPPALAAKFSAGNLTAAHNHWGGIDLTQTVELIEGVEYSIRFDWAATRDAGPVNPEGGVFSVIVENQIIASESAGPTGPLQWNYGWTRGSFVAEVSGPHRVGARITRPYTTVPELYQWVDNFDLSVLPQGACCKHDGSCEILSPFSCDAAGGIFHGGGVSCAAAACPPPGACCLFLGCEVLSAVQCFSRGGSYGGHGVACSAITCEPAGTLLPLPPQLSTSTNELYGRGYWFRAPVDFTITGVRVPDPGGYGLQNVEIVRFETSPPIHVSFATNAFDSLAREIGVPSTNIIPLNIPVRDGDRIGVLGNASEPGSFVMQYTAGEGPFQSLIFGEPVTLTRLSMDGNLIASPAKDLFSTAFMSRLELIEIYYAEATADCYANCDGSTTEPLLTVDDFTCFINSFAEALGLPPEQQATHYANCDGSTTIPVLTVDDFTCFLNAFAQGCP